MSYSLTTSPGVPFSITESSAGRAGTLRIRIVAGGVRVDGVLVDSGSAIDNVYLYFIDPTTSGNTLIKLSVTTTAGEYNEYVDIPDGTYAAGALKVAYSSDGVNIESSPFELEAVPLTGGGSGGGDPNNGGNGYNNMSTLTFNPAYQVDASHSSSVVVYGETAVTRPEYTDALAITVSAANLNKVLSFAKDGEAAATDFKVNLDSIKAAVKTALEARLQTDHALPSLSSMGIDARSILSQTLGAWAADVAPLAVDKTGDVARNVYEQAADKGKLSASAGELNLSSGDTFTFYMDTTATQSLEISIDSGTLAGASTSDVTPLIPLAAIFGATNAAGDKGTITKSWPYKFAVTATVE